MTIWIKRNFEYGDYASEQDKFEKLFLQLRDPRKMMIVALGPVSSQELYASLPNEAYLSLFPGWETCAESELPRVASGPVTNQDEFEKRFKYPDAAN